MTAKNSIIYIRILDHSEFVYSTQSRKVLSLGLCWWKDTPPHALSFNGEQWKEKNVLF